MTVPDCQGDARFESREQADYVAEGLTQEFSTIWQTVEHGAHFHILDTGRTNRG